MANFNDVHEAITNARSAQDPVRYSVRMNDSEEWPAWADICDRVTPRNQTDETCYFDVVVSLDRAADLERALDRDDEVLEYSEVAS